MALGAMMVTGTAATATAASHIDFSGYYKAFQMNDVNLGKQAGDDSFTDSYFGHRLFLDMTFTPTDEIAVYYRLAGPAFERWGAGGDLAMETRFLYGVIKQDWGTVVVGHINDALDTYGLGSLGWNPATNWWASVSPFDSGARHDAIRYSNKWDNGFGIMAQYAKGREGATAGASDDWWSDGDMDRYQLEATYEWDGGGAALGFRYDRDANTAPGVWAFDSDRYFDDFIDDQIAGGPGIDLTDADVLANYRTRTMVDKTDAWYINPAIMHSWGSFSVHAEAMFGWGTTDYLQGTKDADSDGIGFYVDADYNYGPGNVTLAGWWASGTALDDDERSDLVQVDEGNFYPLVVAYNNSASAWGRVGDDSAFNDVAVGGAVADANNAYALFIAPAYSDLTQYGVTDAQLTTAMTDFTRNKGTSNHWALALTGVHAFTDDISMNYGVAYLGLVKPNYEVLETANTTGNVLSEERFKNQEKDLGVEIDLGFKFKLLDNLDFETNFGYMFNGDAYKTLKGYTAPDADDNIKAIWEDPKDTYVWYNTLTFSF